MIAEKYSLERARSTDFGKRARAVFTVELHSEAFALSAGSRPWKITQHRVRSRVS
jgi:hypothetical protein